jgi:hypothetical protein
VRLLEVWRGALWLAGQDARRTWLSFPAAAVVALVVGVYAGGFLFSTEAAGALGERFFGFLRDLWFLTVVPVLGVNFLFNRDYYYRLREDNLSKRLAFLRRLPIPAQTVVACRATIMLLALACAAPAFFLPVYLVSRPLQDRLDPAQYLFFALVWSGYALFAGGFLVFVWLGLSWRTEKKVLMVAFPLFNLLVAGLSNYFVFGAGIVAGTLGLVEEGGAPTAVLALSLGACGFALWGWAAAVYLERREPNA